MCVRAAVTAARYGLEKGDEAGGEEENLKKKMNGCKEGIKKTGVAVKEGKVAGGPLW